MEIRPATDGDLPQIQSIYAHHVLTGTGTFEEVPPSLEEMAERFEKVRAQDLAWLVAADATGVLGYAYYTQFRDRSAYRFTVENSIYVRDDVRGQGVGKALVARLIEEAEAQGFRQMIAVIGDRTRVRDRDTCRIGRFVEGHASGERHVHRARLAGQCLRGGVGVREWVCPHRQIRRRRSNRSAGRQVADEDATRGSPSVFIGVAGFCTCPVDGSARRGRCLELCLRDRQRSCCASCRGSRHDGIGRGIVSGNDEPQHDEEGRDRHNRGADHNCRVTTATLPSRA